MDHYSLIESLFNDFLASGGSPKVTEFKKHVDRLIKDKIKPLCSGHGKSSHGGTGWRSELKARFSGRGAKWVRVETAEVTDTLTRLDEEGFDTSDYRKWIEGAGYAWIRFAGPRVVTGQNMAAFEVRTSGSTFDCPKQLHYIAEGSLDDTIKVLGGTPHAMKLEVIAKTSNDEEAVSEVPVSDAVEVSDETPRDEVVLEVEADVIEETVTAEEVIEVEEVVSSAPTSDDPAEWEAFLEAEGLGADQFEGNDEDIFDSYED